MPRNHVSFATHPATQWAILGKWSCKKCTDYFLVRSILMRSICLCRLHYVLFSIIYQVGVVEDASSSLGRSRGSLFRRFAPYTRTRKGRTDFVFVLPFLFELYEVGLCKCGAHLLALCYEIHKKFLTKY